MEGLILQSISSGYGSLSNSKDIPIIKDLSLIVNPTETMAIMGMSGSGKTTLLKTILGIIVPQKGKIVLHEKDITHTPIEERNIGYLSQDYGLFPHLTVAGNIAYGLRIRGASKQEQSLMVEHMLTLMQMTEVSHKNIQDLSGGQKQRVGLARALATNPKLLLLDEPLTNIDQITKLEVAQHLKRLFHTLKIPVIIVTHQYEDARFLGNRIAILVDGIIEQVGTYDEMVLNPKNPNIKKLLVPFFEQQ